MGNAILNSISELFHLSVSLFWVAAFIVTSLTVYTPLTTLSQGMVGHQPDFKTLALSTARGPMVNKTEYNTPSTLSLHHTSPPGAQEDDHQSNIKLSGQRNDKGLLGLLNFPLLLFFVQSSPLDQASEPLSLLLTAVSHLCLPHVWSLRDATLIVILFIQVLHY